MGDIILAAVIIGIVSLATIKIIYDKKRGVKCIGCPHGGVSKKKDIVKFDL